MDIKTTAHAPGVQDIQEYTPVRKSIAYRALKRGADIVLSLLVIIILAIPLLIVSLAVIIEDGAPAFYTQERVGKDRRKFKIYKFRSMRRDADKMHEQLRHEYGSSDVSFKLKDSEDPRITKVGRFIRRTNIDELPQLVNILKGEMSFVGPRPLATYEYEDEQSRYGDKYSARYDVPQGLTCSWQISSRSEVDFEERMQMDVNYAYEAKFSVDTKLLFKTAIYTVTGRAGYDGARNKQ